LKQIDYKQVLIIPSNFLLENRATYFFGVDKIMQNVILTKQ